MARRHDLVGKCWCGELHDPSGALSVPVRPGREIKQSAWVLVNEARRKLDAGQSNTRAVVLLLDKALELISAADGRTLKLARLLRTIDRKLQGMDDVAVPAVRVVRASISVALKEGAVRTGAVRKSGK